MNKIDALENKYNTKCTRGTMSWLTPSVIITIGSGIVVITAFVVVTRNNQKWVAQLFGERLSSLKFNYDEKLKFIEDKIKRLFKKTEEIESLKLNQQKLLESDQARKQFVDKEIFHNEINATSAEISKLVESNYRLYKDMEWLKKEHAVSSTTLLHITDSIEELIGMVRKIQEK